MTSAIMMRGSWTVDFSHLVEQVQSVQIKVAGLQKVVEEHEQRWTSILGSYQPGLLHDLLVRYFDNDEMADLCHRIDVNWDDVPGDARPRKTMALIAYLKRRHRLFTLLQVASELRPAVDWSRYQS